MRKRIVAANWKMNTDAEEAGQLLEAIMNDYDQYALNDQKEVILAVPFLYLKEFADQLEEYPHLHLAAQNCHQEEKGAYTGEISARQLSSVNTTHVILGHSERREYFAETDEMLARKIDMTLSNGLIPVFCCGESLTVRNSGDYIAYILRQLENSLWHLDADKFANIIIAYEPVWAIGTGRTASTEQAQEVHAAIRAHIASKFGTGIADATTILYGGSCNAGNARSLFSAPDVDGGLVGGASLKAEEFKNIIAALS